MLKRERQAIILHQLEDEGVVYVSQLAAELEVSPITIRRDLSQLEDEGQLRRVHGGALLREGASVGRLPSGLERRIAEAGTRLLSEKSVVFLGPGTITPEMAPFLREYPHLTIMTNALNVAWAVARQQTHPLHLIGGQVQADDGVYGDADALRGIRADWVVLEASGLDAARGLTHDQHYYAEMGRVLLSLRAQVMVLLRPEQVGGADALFIAPAEAVDVLVTGREAANAPLWDLSELGVRVVLT
ncbi:MAG: DeoR/GlpR family DNA-binding transcription regulator [Anaerolineales bacterium]